MSAPLAGKFQDHYEVLGVDPKCDLDTIQSVYPGLAQQYHPNNPETGDEERFEAINLAYEVLSDPGLRREFDKVKGVGAEENVPQFSGLDFFVSLGREAGLRSAILCVLYDRRRASPQRPSLSIRHTEMMLSATSEELFFALWYLKQRRWVAADDKSSLQITVDGMDYLEANRPSPEIVMRLIKPASVAPPKSSTEAILQVGAVGEIALALEPEGMEEAFIAEPDVVAAPVVPEASSALKALREALTGAANRVTASR